ncbi:MAG: Arylsulfatase [Verrucomicrobiota bacterium]|jgi:arylsulfatase A-like enzyme
MKFALFPACVRLLAALPALLGAGPILAAPAASAPPRPPNVVLIFCDDLGYGDLGCYGAKGYRTPHLDQLARDGMRFTDFYVPQAVCSASRAALLTGCYPNRVGILGALGPNARVGLHSNEWTLAEMLRERGYATAVYGKWHLGRPAEFLPPAHGFDEYFGLPYSNDMWPHHPTGGTNYPPLPLIEGTEVVRLMPNQSQLTTWFTERAVKFIDTHAARPFFLYVPHPMPHVPLFVSDKFKGSTPRGLFGDVLAEIDWSVGQILDALRRHRLEEDTLVIFTSDNGPWLSYGDHAGSSGGFREGKGTAWEGGVRVPFLARWPGRIPRGTVCREPAMTIDVFPTVAGLAGGRLPEHPIDGRDLWPLLSGRKGASSPHEALWFYWDSGLHAIRSGSWKLHFPHSYVQPNPPGNGGRPGRMLNPRTDLALYDLAADPGETRDLSAAHPEVVARLQVLADRARADLGDGLLRMRPTGARPPGRVRD